MTAQTPVAGLLLDGRYRLDDRPVEGGMGNVFRATDEKRDRPVAVKFLADRHLADHTLRDRFRREASVLASLSHPNIVEIIDHGDWEGRPYLVTEWFSQGDVLRRIHLLVQGPLPVEVAVGYTIGLLRALDHCHQQGIVHRDVKPANLFIADDGEVKLGDFGIVLLEEEPRLTVVGTSPFTPSHAAPELFSGRTPQPATDIYAAGITLWEMLSGDVPYGLLPGSAIDEYRDAHLTEDPGSLPAFVPARVENVARKALAKAPEKRFGSAKEMVEALEQAVASTRSSKRPRVRWVAIAAAVLLLAVGAVVAMVMLKGRKPGGRKAAMNAVAQTSTRGIRSETAGTTRSGGRGPSHGVGIGGGGLAAPARVVGGDGESRISPTAIGADGRRRRHRTKDAPRAGPARKVPSGRLAGPAAGTPPKPVSTSGVRGTPAMPQPEHQPGTPAAADPPSERTAPKRAARVAGRRTRRSVRRRRRRRTRKTIRLRTARHRSTAKRRARRKRSIKLRRKKKDAKRKTVAQPDKARVKAGKKKPLKKKVARPKPKRPSKGPKWKRDVHRRSSDAFSDHEREMRRYR